ncbi:hypothetical protein SNOG_02737 [Parastagonospora nodorum SN15]|uniref:Alcohol dehydrogenase-like N-terminal domain-containing protein n=1 Tax=Phaeosphaeria nodorum (strain SN15 / ATCC MYA-4574 / FGSC 10173) TaxID=321614 RepID=Q0UZS7_PHANO|nr:hypothetical protein SNOG_02737 [Parastagonospora nodorum SN15]EAT89468.2 hypothetical protein SNOG_02737 [Parastagonospora nodorum SN15]
MGSVTDQKTMRAQQFDHRDNQLHLNEVPIPTPQAHELLVKMSCASLCHSDTMLFVPNEQGLILGPNPVVTIGHEGTGRVVSTGSGEIASRFSKGDPVGFICPVDCCFECYACKEVHNSWCKTGKTQMQGFGRDGYFAEYAVVDARNAMVLPDNCEYSRNGVTAYHGIADCELPPGSWLAVIGSWSSASTSQKQHSRRHVAVAQTTSSTPYQTRTTRRRSRRSREVAYTQPSTSRQARSRTMTVLQSSSLAREQLWLLVFRNSRWSSMAWI